MLWQSDGACYVEGNTLDAHAEGDIGRRLCESGVHNDGVGFRVGQRDVEGQALHERHFEMFEFVPQRVVDVQGADGPLEGRANPQLRRNPWCTRNGVVAGFDTEALTEGRQTFQSQPDREVVCTISIDVDVVHEQHKVRADQQLAREGALVPCLIGGAIVAGREIHVNGVGVDTDAQEIVKPKVLDREQRLPKIVRPCIGMGGNIGQEFVGAWVVLLKGRGVPKFNLVQHVLCVSQGIAGLNRSLGGVKQRKRRLCTLNGDQGFALCCSVSERVGEGIENTKVIACNGYIAGNRLHHREQHDGHEQHSGASTPIGLTEPNTQEA